MEQASFSDELYKSTLSSINKLVQQEQSVTSMKVDVTDLVKSNLLKKSGDDQNSELESANWLLEKFQLETSTLLASVQVS